MTVVVIPQHNDNLDFLTEWDELKSPDVKIIVVEDHPTRRIKVPRGFDITIYSHTEIKKDLGEKAWIIPRQTSACRSYGYYKAWQLQPDYIMTLDTDCFPDNPYPYWTVGHKIELDKHVTLDWVNTAQEYPHQELPMRGFPYGIRNKADVLLNHGLWSNVPDLDAATWLHNYGLRFSPTYASVTIPKHNYFPMCGMNLAWKTELTPAMYFGLFGPDYGFDQYDDIWAGVLVKKVLDHLGFAARSGFPSVEHRKQSNVFTNLKKQAPGLAMNEHFWKEVDKIKLNSSTIQDAYKELIQSLPDVIEEEPEGYTKKFKEAALLWVSLFDD